MNILNTPPNSADKSPKTVNTTIIAGIDAKANFTNNTTKNP